MVGFRRMQPVRVWPDMIRMPTKPLLQDRMHAGSSTMWSLCRTSPCRAWCYRMPMVLPARSSSAQSAIRRLSPSSSLTCWCAITKRLASVRSICRPNQTRIHRFSSSTATLPAITRLRGQPLRVAVSFPATPAVAWSTTNAWSLMA